MDSLGWEGEDKTLRKEFSREHPPPSSSTLGKSLCRWDKGASLEFALPCQPTIKVQVKEGLSGHRKLK